MMDATDFESKGLELLVFAEQFKWICVSSDGHSCRVSFVDETRMIRVDIYTSKMTVCMVRKGEKPRYFKNQTLDQIKQLFKNPYTK